MATPNAILIHGNGGCTAVDIWFPWLERELTALGVAVTNETFPDNMKARAQFWLPHIAALGADEHTILIGHSSGAVAAMRYAETHRLLGSILLPHQAWDETPCQENKTPPVSLPLSLFL